MKSERISKKKTEAPLASTSAPTHLTQTATSPLPTQKLLNQLSPKFLGNKKAQYWGTMTSKLK
jgi:hypothetical protein